MTFSLPSVQAAAPPQAPVHPQKLEKHGDVRVDNYYWLRNYPQDPAVLKYLQAENAYTDAMMADTEALQDKLYLEMVGHMVEKDRSVPHQKGDYFYYSRIDPGQNYQVYCRRKGSMQGPEEVLLDLNLEATDQDFMDLGIYEVSPDQRYLAYSLDTTGAESFTLHIKDLQTGQVLSEQIPQTYYAVEWAADSKTLFYNVIDSANRPYRLYRHTVGSEPNKDLLVFEEPDERYNVEIKKTASGKYLILQIESLTTTECLYLPADQPTAAPVMIQARREGIEYHVQDSGSRFLIHTNDGALNFTLKQAPIQSPDASHWQSLVVERPDAKLEHLKVFDQWLAMIYRTDARQEVRVQHLITGKTATVDFPEQNFSVWPSTDQDFAKNILRVSYSSMLTPKSVFDVHLENQSLELRKQTSVPGYEPTRYVTERIYATAPDGVKVPVSLIYKRGLKKQGKNPALLYSYGAYGSSTDTDFDSDRISLLERGFVFALAHIRGGEDMGRKWYLEGKLQKKRNTFSDFVASAEALIQGGFTSPQQLVIEGGSAGGLLMGAVTNLRPDLFKGVIADVPFVDALTTMLDPGLPLTVIEYDEWGNPNKKPDYDYIKSYSPYDNLAAKAYPNMLVLAGLNDPRVKYWEPAKYVAKMRALKTDQNLLMLQTHMSAGHGGASGRYDFLKEVAFKYAFFCKVLGIQH
ncbi:oligopeptidase B [bacterium (Candidatus Blackallbacteria) CG17_big_fil_post_rev_8_21_14_2_50_48_46]|uniref:Oligopeptidase B n=1 Tax=bacterium (Candidatus Blackallbacteria) CG17_big_fil_post_rev_8_21_14_2_50_48_46 TaxID=2014261 RepID=A0A2M7G0Z9_9BACT|nr:MAG: oligopeptidase B [bacterium (Candidatus Blackallbacteria) CG18_big_fil_WC_8_21_14_2_50_49_26]PIW15381.1 MAG: oligopeptidase B [bacterium (Candidatus Blackallbacteria) CG17_big_fil_post_rev_8_21_14_2_50_48_46]PIW49758.1 MAG: oligopeptidase B [bacterium (Candidatus Blackallbacteria) CG13_big_fil_rev_8_21_14_2_50_49_14]